MASCKDCIHEEVCNYFDVDLNEEAHEKATGKEWFLSSENPCY